MFTRPWWGWVLCYFGDTVVFWGGEGFGTTRRDHGKRERILSYPEISPLKYLYMEYC